MSSKRYLSHIVRRLVGCAERGGRHGGATTATRASSPLVRSLWSDAPGVARVARVARVASYRRGFASNHVFDSVVNFSVMDRTGNVHALRGLEGQTLADVFAQNTAVLGADCVAASPEGRGKVEAHVKVPSEWFGAVAADEGEAREVLEELVGDTGLDGHSRLGSRVVLGKDMEGITVSVGGVYPWKNL